MVENAWLTTLGGSSGAVTLCRTTPFLIDHRGRHLAAITVGEIAETVSPVSAIPYSSKLTTDGYRRGRQGTIG